MVKNSYVNSYAIYVGYRNYVGYVNVTVTELFSVFLVITNVGITRNSGVLAELTYLLAERIALVNRSC